jgi:hypothetical protein
VARTRTGGALGRDVPLSVQLRSRPTASHENVIFVLLIVVAVMAPSVTPLSGEMASVF